MAIGTNLKNHFFLLVPPSVGGDALQTSQGISFSGGSTAAVVVADVVSAAAEVVPMLAEGSICRVLLTLIYPIIIKTILRP